MDIETNRTKGEGDGSSSAQFRSKPFLTILDGNPTAKGRNNRSYHRSSKQKTGKTSRSTSLHATHSSSPRPATLIRKSGTKLQSYAVEGAHNFASTIRKGIVAASKALSNLQSKKDEKAISFAARESAPREEVSAVQPIEARATAETTETRNINKKVNRMLVSLKTEAKIVATKVAAFRPASIRAPRIILSILIAAIAISAGAAAIISAKNFPVAPDSLLLPDEDSAQAALMAYLEPDSADKENLPSGSLPPIPVSVAIQSYTVKSGDSLDRIAKRFGLRQDTIISANNLQSAGSIHSGLKLRIPNMDGISHKVRKGENLSTLARTYAIDMTRIVDANDLASGTISAGQSLFIPNARLSSASLRDFYGERFIWPARGGISSPFGYRENPFSGLRTYHSAIDIVVSWGTKVKATCDGKVADTGYNSVFGNYIILKHANGYQSLYAHLSTVSVKEGASVSQGAIIGNSGNTGQSTGPHLHFSIFKNGQALDPRKYVK